MAQITLYAAISHHAVCFNKTDRDGGRVEKAGGTAMSGEGDEAKGTIHGGGLCPKSNCPCHVFNQAYRNITKHFVFLIQISQQPYEIGIMNPMLQMRKLWFGKVRFLFHFSIQIGYPF